MRGPRAAVLALGTALLAPGARADPPPVPFRISTWNLEWMTTRPAGDPSLPDDAAPKRPEDIVTLAGYAARLAPAVVAMQEVDTAALVEKLFPPDRYRVFITGDGVVQKVALAVRNDIPVARHPDLAALDVSASGHALRSGLDVTVTLAGRELRLLAVHLKSGCWQAALSDPRHACRDLAEQLPVLESWIAARRRENMPFLVLGDFNRRFLPGDAFLAALREGGPLASATEGRSSPCWGGEEFIDQILAGDAARNWVRPGSLRVMVFHETAPEMKDRLSDHCPVSIALDVPPGS